MLNSCSELSVSFGSGLTVIANQCLQVIVIGGLATFPEVLPQIVPSQVRSRVLIRLEVCFLSFIGYTSINVYDIRYTRVINTCHVASYLASYIRTS